MKFRAAITGAALWVVSLPAFAAGFPVTIENAFGTTTVASKPLRVVSIGYVEQDFLYALGVAPVAVREWFGGYPYATWPWADAARQAVNATPEVYAGDAIDLEWVLNQNPDLIVGTFLEMDQSNYNALSKIAPVIALPKGYDAWSAPWQEELKAIDLGTSGDTAHADRIIADTEAKFARVRAAYPQFAGKTGTNIYFADGAFTLFGESDPASRFLIDLGLTFPQTFIGQGAAAEGNVIDVSQENLRLLDFDVAVWPLSPAAASTHATVDAMPLYQQMRLFKENRSVWLDGDNGVMSGALTYQSPLAIDYLLDNLPPMIASALAGTPVAQP